MLAKDTKDTKDARSSSSVCRSNAPVELSELDALAADALDRVPGGVDEGVRREPRRIRLRRHGVSSHKSVRRYGSSARREGRAPPEVCALRTANLVATISLSDAGVFAAQNCPMSFSERPSSCPVPYLGGCTGRRCGPQLRLSCPLLWLRMRLQRAELSW